MTFVFFTDRDLGIAFPEILRDSGLTVERHRDHFPPACPDEEWLEVVGRRGWVALTHDTRIRYKPNQLEKVVQHNVRLLVLVGKATFPDLARSFVATYSRIDAFLQRNPAPLIAKVYRASPAELKGNPSAPGRIELSFPR